MKDAADKDRLRVHSIDDDMLAVLHTPIAFPDLVTWMTDPRRLSEQIEALIEKIAIPTGLFDTPPLECVLDDPA